VLFVCLLISSGAKVLEEHAFCQETQQEGLTQALRRRHVAAVHGVLYLMP